jgi:AcrR family transcriptional regulator
MSGPEAQRGESRQRVIDAALVLFAEHGVSGTSLQDIADALGVTKAAVYFQFRTKREIVLAVLEPILDQLHAVVASATDAKGAAGQRQHVLEGLIDVFIAHARVATFWQRDRFVAEIIAADPRLQTIAQAIGVLLAGTRPTTRVRVAVSLVAGGIVQARSDPGLADLDDRTLRRELLACANAALTAGARS